MYRGLILVAAVFLALGSWWYFKVLPASYDSTIETPEMATTTESQWQWEFDPAGEGADGMPKTNVMLRNGGTLYSIGTQAGTCSDITKSDWGLLTDEGELAGAICWWAGGGIEIGVFSDGGRALIKLGDVEEGTAEGGGFRGNFETLFVIDFGYIRGFDMATGTIAFDDALWLTGQAGEDAAIDAGLCTDADRSQCLPNDFYIYNADPATVTIPLASNLTIYMLTWNAGEEGIKRQAITRSEFATLINDASLHWDQLPYNITVNKEGEAIMIEEVYVP